jgi:hypothetical protein
MVTVSDTEEQHIDVKIEIISNFMKHETQYVHHLKKLREIRSHIPDQQIIEFFDFIDPIFRLHEKLREKLFDRIADEKNTLGDIFQSLLDELLTIYTRYCILWLDIQSSLIQTKQHYKELNSAITDFESSYGNTIEHFLEKITQHLPEMNTIISELLKHTNKETSSQEFTQLKEVSAQLQNFTDKIKVLRSINKDSQRSGGIQRCDTVRSKSRRDKRPTLNSRLSVRW